MNAQQVYNTPPLGIPKVAGCTSASTNDQASWCPSLPRSPIYWERADNCALSISSQMIQPSPSIIVLLLHLLHGVDAEAKDTNERTPLSHLARGGEGAAACSLLAHATGGECGSNGQRGAYADTPGSRENWTHAAS